MDVNGLVASSLQISNSDFLAGKMNFSAGAVAGRVANQGRISTPGGGQVILIAPQVENTGIIHSPGGDVGAGRGPQRETGRKRGARPCTWWSARRRDQAVNLGQIVAQSGRKVGIYGNLINQRGLVSARAAQWRAPMGRSCSRPAVTCCWRPAA